MVEVQFVMAFLSFGFDCTLPTQINELELTATAGLGRERLLLTELFDPSAGLLSQVF